MVHNDDMVVIRSKDVKYKFGLLLLEINASKTICNKRTIIIVTSCGQRGIIWKRKVEVDKDATSEWL